ncbi:14305_t:CDS:2, partial [Cetraspora pellucida]
KECAKCKNQLMEPKDFDSESLSQESQVSLHSTNTYYETDADDFIDDSELRMDDSSSSKYQIDNEIKVKFTEQTNLMQINKKIIDQYEGECRYYALCLIVNSEKKIWM